jgi:hypothetical protein
LEQAALAKVQEVAEQISLQPKTVYLLVSLHLYLELVLLMAVRVHGGGIISQTPRIIFGVVVQVDHNLLLVHILVEDILLVKET